MTVHPEPQQTHQQTHRRRYSYYARRPALLRQLEAQIRGTTPTPNPSDAPAAAVAVAEAAPRPFPGPHPEGYAGVVGDGGWQQKRLAQLKARLGGEATRRALEAEVGGWVCFGVVGCVGEMVQQQQAIEDVSIMSSPKT